MIASFFVSLAASIVAVILVLWLERQRRPRLAAIVQEPTKVEFSDLTRVPCTWLRIGIINEPCPWWLSWVYQREPALGVRGYISFHQPCGCFLKEGHMPVRWSDTPEAKLQSTEINGKIVGYLLDDIKETDILANSIEPIHPVITFPDNTIFGWTNESYAYSWKHPVWEIGEDHFIILLKLTCSDRSFKWAFKVTSNGYGRVEIEKLEAEFIGMYSRNT